MKAIVNTGANLVEMTELPLPEPGPAQVRIRTGACGICATDLAMIAGWDRTGFPAIPGHEWAGTVDAVGTEADQALMGRNCVAENVLSDGGEVGFEHPGGYAEYFLTEAANVQPLPERMNISVASLIEPLAVAVRARRRLRSDAAGPVLIFGDGPIGLLMLLLVGDPAGRTVLVGGREQRLKLAEQFGASETLNYHTVTGTLAAAVAGPDGRKFPTVIEASGSAEALAAGMEVVSRCGRLLVVGDYGEAQAKFPWNDLLLREIELIGSNASAGAWPEAVKLAVEGSLPLERLVTHRLPAEQFRRGIELVRSRSGDVVKVVLEWT